MPGSGFRAPWRGRKARNSAPNPRVKERQPRHRQAPIQSPPVEARVSVRERPCIGFFAFNTHDLCPSSRVSHKHTTSLCRLLPVRQERNNLSTLLLSRPIRFRFCCFYTSACHSASLLSFPKQSAISQGSAISCPVQPLRF